MGKTTKAEVEKAKREYREALVYHYSLPESEAWKNGKNLKRFEAKVEMLIEAFKLGM